MKLIRANTDLGSQAELASIVEPCTCIDNYCTRIDLPAKCLNGGDILADDCIGVMRAVFVDMGDSLRQAFDYFYTDFGTEILLTLIRICGLRSVC